MTNSQLPRGFRAPQGTLELGRLQNEHIHMWLFPWTLACLFAYLLVYFKMPGESKEGSLVTGYLRKILIHQAQNSGTFLLRMHNLSLIQLLRTTNVALGVKGSVSLFIMQQFLKLSLPVQHAPCSVSEPSVPGELILHFQWFPLQISSSIRSLLKRVSTIEKETF